MGLHGHLGEYNLNMRKILNEVVNNIKNTDEDVLNERLKIAENNTFSETINHVLLEESRKCQEANEKI